MNKPKTIEELHLLQCRCSRFATIWKHNEPVCAECDRLERRGYHPRCTVPPCSICGCTKLVRLVNMRDRSTSGWAWQRDRISLCLLCRTDLQGDWRFTVSPN